MQKENTITFDQLDLPDIRFCEILSVTDILKNPKKEPGEENPVKAYHLVINTGFDERDVVTNVVDKFTKDQLLFRVVPFVLNLAPTEIRGVLSKAMIVPAQGMDGRLTLTTGPLGAKLL